MEDQEIVEPATEESDESTQVEEVAVVEEDSTTPENEPDDTAEPAAEPKSGVQKRIDRAVAAQRQAERDSAYLRGQLEAMKKNDVVPTPKEVVKPLDVDDFETDAQYYAEVSKRTANEAVKTALNERDKNDRIVQERVAQKSVEEKWDKSVQEFAVDNPDFYDVALSAPRSQAMIEAVMVSENGPAVGYYLGKNPDESARIAAMTPYGAVMEIGKLSQKLNDPVPKKVTNAPKPHTPVGSGSGNVNGKLSDEEWIKRRNKEKYGA